MLEVNGDCDGSRDSYDAMVLLTGRLDLNDVPGFLLRDLLTKHALFRCLMS